MFFLEPKNEKAAPRYIEKRERVFNGNARVEGEGVVSLPGGSARGPLLVVEVSLSAQTSVLLSRRSETAKLSVLVDRVAQPVDPRVVADRIVSHVHHDHLKVLVSRVLQLAHITTYHKFRYSKPTLQLGSRIIPNRLIITSLSQ